MTQQATFGRRHATMDAPAPIRTALAPALSEPTLAMIAPASEDDELAAWRKSRSFTFAGLTLTIGQWGWLAASLPLAGLCATFLFVSENLGWLRLALLGLAGYLKYAVRSRQSLRELRAVQGDPGALDP